VSGPAQPILKDCRAGMERALENTRKEFGTIRTNKATPNLLDTIKVEAYGQFLPINQVAGISVPEPRMITVTPWDKGLAQPIEKAIRDSDLGLNPASQGGVIRVPLPALNEQRRKELVKVLHKLGEEGRVAVRHARTDAREKLKKLEHVSKDDVQHAEKDLQKVHDEYMTKIDELLKHKEAEVMEV
jgi:ribosome recycling factor